MSIIENLYYGKAIPFEKSIEINQEEKKLLDEIIELQFKLTENFNEDQKELFEKYNECQNKLNSVLEEKKFKEGFIMAAKLLIQIVNDK